VRFAVQDLFEPAAVADRSAQEVQRAGEKLAVRAGQFRCPVVVGHEGLGL